MRIKAIIESPDIQIGTEIKEKINSKNIKSYTELEDLPELDGVKIIGNISEKDPTVPEWAKNSEKPRYSSEEIGAVSENNAISIEELAEMFK